MRVDVERELRGPDGRLHYLNQALPHGPWHGEPDRVEIQHADLTCVLDRDNMGSWSGYVALPTNHPWVADDLDPTLESGPWHDAVHGGITYCSQRSPISARIQHGVIWIGFDCAHARKGDLIPAYAQVVRGTYRDYTFALGELLRLADATHAAR
jgi:hypothetical protein